ncbi:hypothetical protein IHE44_0000046 [Lamprotornis superbus]|uniref:VPS9 domain-containing protein n=1 Tax=Lamprotornis superbus TaxID=245042 RepID=A0A835NQF3_9PASS|nr:hypothetical protein IHE44_0000046 [Lamprotornis superbus]
MPAGILGSLLQVEENFSSCLARIDALILKPLLRAEPHDPKEKENFQLLVLLNDRFQALWNFTEENSRILRGKYGSDSGGIQDFYILWKGDLFLSLYIQYFVTFANFVVVQGFEQATRSKSEAWKLHKAVLKEFLRDFTSESSLAPALHLVLHKPFRDHIQSCLQLLAQLQGQLQQDVLCVPERRLLEDSRNLPIASGSARSERLLLFDDVLVLIQGNSFQSFDLKLVWVDENCGDKSAPGSYNLRITTPEETFVLSTKDPQTKQFLAAFLELSPVDFPGIWADSLFSAVWRWKLEQAVRQALNGKRDFPLWGRSGEGSEAPARRFFSYVFRTEGRLRGATYEGEWLWGKPHGKFGICLVPRRSEDRYDCYKCHWYQGRMRGYGICEYGNDLVYKGYFKDNVRQGFGILENFSVEHPFKYTGQWENDKKNGYGVWEDKERGERYIGMWRDDLRHGDGIVVTQAGLCYQRTFQADKMVGSGILLLEDDSVYEGNFTENLTFVGKGLRARGAPEPQQRPPAQLGLKEFPVEKRWTGIFEQFLEFLHSGCKEEMEESFTGFHIQSSKELRKSQEYLFCQRGLLRLALEQKGRAPPEEDPRSVAPCSAFGNYEGLRNSGVNFLDISWSFRFFFPSEFPGDLLELQVFFPSEFPGDLLVVQVFASEFLGDLLELQVFPGDSEDVLELQVFLPVSFLEISWSSKFFPLNFLEIPWSTNSSWINLWPPQPNHAQLGKAKKRGEHLRIPLPRDAGLQKGSSLVLPLILPTFYPELSMLYMLQHQREDKLYCQGIVELSLFSDIQLLEFLDVQKENSGKIESPLDSLLVFPVSPILLEEFLLRSVWLEGEFFNGKLLLSLLSLIVGWKIPKLFATNYPEFRNVYEFINAPVASQRSDPDLQPGEENPRSQLGMGMGMGMELGLGEAGASLNESQQSELRDHHSLWISLDFLGFPSQLFWDGSRISAAGIPEVSLSLFQRRSLVKDKCFLSATECLQKLIGPRNVPFHPGTSPGPTSLPPLSSTLWSQSMNSISPEIPNFFFLNPAFPDAAFPRLFYPHSTTVDPREKLEILRKTYEELEHTVSRLLEKEFRLPMDDLLPLLMFVVSRAKIQHLGAEIHLIRDLMDPTNQGGMLDFLLTALEIEFCWNYPRDQQGLSGCRSLDLIPEFPNFSLIFALFPPQSEEFLPSRGFPDPKHTGKAGISISNLWEFFFQAEKTSGVILHCFGILGAWKKPGFILDFGKFWENKQKRWNRNSNPSWICALSWNFLVEKESLGYSQWIFGMPFAAFQTHLKIVKKISFLTVFIPLLKFYLEFFSLSRKTKLLRLFPHCFFQIFFLYPENKTPQAFSSHFPQILKFNPLINNRLITIINILTREFHGKFARNFYLNKTLGILKISGSTCSLFQSDMQSAEGVKIPRNSLENEVDFQLGILKCPEIPSFSWVFISGRIQEKQEGDVPLGIFGGIPGGNCAVEPGRKCWIPFFLEGMLGFGMEHGILWKCHFGRHGINIPKSRLQLRNPGIPWKHHQLEFPKKRMEKLS